MHSWRVLLVPLVEANAFTSNYDFSAGWNDPENADLADGTRRNKGDKFSDPSSVREVYQPHLTSLSPEDFTTDFLMVADGNEPLTSDAGIPPPSGGGGWRVPERQTTGELIIVQVRRSDVHWMEPRDIVLTSPAPDWGIPLDDIKDDIVGSVLVSDGRVMCNDREATLKLLAERQSRMKAGKGDSPTKR